MDYRNAFDLTGSVAVVTGGSSGIGFKSAVALGSCGAKVVLAARDRSALDAAAKRLVETGVNAAYAVLDVTDPTAVTKAADAIVAEQGKLTSWSIAPASPDSIRQSKRLTTNGAR
jgi:galactitol 2-dehydrogenase (L-tagatose-forming)